MKHHSWLNRTQVITSCARASYSPACTVKAAPTISGRSSLYWCGGARGSSSSSRGFGSATFLGEVGSRSVVWKGSLLTTRLRSSKPNCKPSFSYFSQAKVAQIQKPKLAIVDSVLADNPVIADASSNSNTPSSPPKPQPDAVSIQKVHANGTHKVPSKNSALLFQIITSVQKAAAQEQNIVQLLDRYKRHSADTKLWTRVLEKLCYSQRISPEVALEVLAWVAQDTDGKINEKQCKSVLTLATRHGNTRVLPPLFELMARFQVSQTLLHYNLAIASYIRSGPPGNVLTLYNEIRALFQGMKAAQIQPDAITYNSALKVLDTVGLTAEAEELVLEMIEEGVRPTGVTYLALIKMYGRSPERLPKAEAVFHEMLKDWTVTPEVAHFSAMMSAYARAGASEDTERLYQDLVSRGLQPDHMVYVARITAQGLAKRASGASAIFAEMQSARLTPNLISWTALVDALARSEDFLGAEKALQQLKEAGIQPTARSFTVLLDAYMISGRSEEATCLSQRMAKDFKVAPTVAIYTVQIQHLCNVAAYQEASDVLKTMLQARMKPDLHLFVTITSALCARLRDEGEGVGTLLEMIASCNTPMFRITSGFLNNSWSSEELSQQLDGLHGLTFQQLSTFYSLLISVLWDKGLRGRAAQVFQEARSRGLFQRAFSSGENEWTVDLHKVSPGAAQVMLLTWFQQLQSAWEQDKEAGCLPRVVRAITGWGKHSPSTEEAVVGRAVGRLLGELGAPLEPSRLGSFVASGEQLRIWLLQPGTAARIAMKDDLRSLYSPKCEAQSCTG